MKRKKRYEGSQAASRDDAKNERDDETRSISGTT